MAGFLSAVEPALAVTNALGNPRLPFPVDRLSSGALMLLDRNGDLVIPPRSVMRPTTADESLQAGLDPRVGPNVRLGADPSQLPSNQRAQAEPHIVRHPTQPDTLLATFQEGRFTNGGAVDCGYAVSYDGGLTWTRALIPFVTTVVGGIYPRATDPVAGIDRQGWMYLNTLGSLDNSFGLSALLLSRSTNGGVSFDPPKEITRSPDPSVLVDKNWMAINLFSNTPTVGRIVSTFTRFDNNGSPIAITYSDDHGSTWSPWRYVTPVPFNAQGSQPVFLHSGKLAVVYWNFSPVGSPLQTIEIAVSTNGGGTFGFSNRVAQVDSYDAPQVRDGTFLPSAAGNEMDDSIYVVYQGRLGGVPRVLFTKSTNAGATWAAPVAISDNLGGTPVFNPAIGVSPDGKTLSVVFYDGRVNPTNAFLVDVFLAQSFDGGQTWQPNLRVTTTSSDVRSAPLTASGYMLGDYLAVAASVSPDVPAVPIFVDARGSTPDPYVARVGCDTDITFPAWRAARFSLADIQRPEVAGKEADPDGDLVANFSEYALGSNPFVPDRQKMVTTLLREGPAIQLVTGYTRLKNTADTRFEWLSSNNLHDWTPTVPVSETVSTNVNPRLEDVSARFEVEPGPASFFRAQVQPR
jgi:hypothetical protein